jgi:Tol biopolymer transport system component
MRAAFVSFIICVVQPAAAQTTFLDFNIGAADGLSGNGRFVVHFGTAYGLTSGLSIYDRQTGLHERVDVSSTDVPSNNVSFCPSVSGTGRFVAFVSAGNNLVADDSNFVPDVFVRDRQTGQTTRESFYANGTQLFISGAGCPTISDDGRYVVFNTQEPLVPADTIGGNDIYVRDRMLGTTTPVSVTSAGQFVFPHGASSRAQISANGRFVTWNAYGSLVPGVTGFQVYVRDLQTSQTTLASRSTGGAPGDYISGIPTISGDGRYVAFYSRASNLLDGETSVFSSAFVHDRETGETSLVSVSSTGAKANFHAGLDTESVPSISYDGRYVAFDTRANNLVPSDTNNAEDIFIRDRLLQRTFRATLKSDDSEAASCLLNGETAGPTSFLSQSGDEILFSTALQLVHFDSPPGCFDSFHPYIRHLSPAPPSGFTDDLLTSGTMVKVVHITELRTRIDALRVAHALPAYNWTDPTLTAGSSMVRAQHILDLRTALSEAYAAAAVTAPIYTDPGLGVGTRIKAVHIAQLRSAILALE